MKRPLRLKLVHDRSPRSVVLSRAPLEDSPLALSHAIVDESKRTISPAHVTMLGMGGLAARTPSLPIPALKRAKAKTSWRVSALPSKRPFPIALDFSRKEVRLPFGVPRYINAVTLREIAGGGSSDQLMKKVGGAWEFVED